MRDDDSERLDQAVENIAIALMRLGLGDADASGWGAVEALSKSVDGLAEAVSDGASELASAIRDRDIGADRIDLSRAMARAIAEDFTRTLREGAPPSPKPTPPGFA